MSSDREIFSKEIHRKVVRKFPRRHVMVNGIDNIWAIDLASMESVAKENEGYKFIYVLLMYFQNMHGRYR